MKCRKCKERESVDARLMQRVIEEILTRKDVRDAFLSHENCIVKIEPPRPVPLLIKKSRGRVVILEDNSSDFILTHQDRSPSGPEIEFEILEDGTWEVAAFRERYRKKSKRAIEYIEGCRVVRPVRQKRQIKAAVEWGRALVTFEHSSGILRSIDSW
jgi:hypothetical protein